MNFKKIFIVMAIVTLLSLFSLYVGAMTKEKPTFKIIIDSIVNNQIDYLKVDISVSEESDTDEVGVKYDNYYFETLYLTSDSIEITRPSDYFIISIDESNIPYGYRLVENNVTISPDSNIYKFHIESYDEYITTNEEVIVNTPINNLCDSIVINGDRSFPIYTPTYTNYYTYIAGGYKIYYDVNLTYGLTYATRLYNMFQLVESFYCSLGYSKPTTDNSVLEVYIDNISGYNGITISNGTNSLIIINESLFNYNSDTEAFADTVAHEYFHAQLKQNGYLCNTSWLEEACATAIGFYFICSNGIYSPTIKNNYKILVNSTSPRDSFYNNSYNQLSQIDEYCGFLFGFYLIEEFGLNFVIDMFSPYFTNKMSFNDLNSALILEGTTYTEEYNSFAKKGLYVNDYPDIDDYYTEEWNLYTYLNQPTVHIVNPSPGSDNHSITISPNSCVYLAFKPYNGNCENYQLQVTITLSAYQDVDVYYFRLADLGTYYYDLNIPTTYNYAMGGYSYTYVGLQLGPSICREMNFVIVNSSNSDVTLNSSSVVRHIVPQVQTNYNYTIGNELNDFNYLKFIPYGTGFYRFTLDGVNTPIYSSEIQIKDNQLTTIDRYSIGNMSLPASNRELSTNIVAFLYEGEEYYIKIRDETSIPNHKLRITGLMDSFTPSTQEPFGIWDEVMKKDDYMYRFTVPQNGTYSIYFICFYYNNHDMGYLISKKTAYGFNELVCTTLSDSVYYYLYTGYLNQGDEVYIGYFDFRGPNTESCDIVVEKIS